MPPPDGKYSFNAEHHILSLDGNDNFYGDKFGFTMLSSYSNTPIKESGKSGTDRTTNRGSLLQVLQLPLPNNLNDITVAKWSSSPYSLISQNAVNIIDTAVVSQFTGNTLKESGAWTKDVKNLLQNQLSTLTKDLSDEVLSLLGGNKGDAEISIQKIAGAATNNNDTIFFEGHGVESFSLSFDIVPLNKLYYEKATTILKHIILNSSADFTDGETQTYWNIPGNFKINVFVPTKDGVKEFYTRSDFKIKSIAINFNSSGNMTFHPDGELTKFSVQFDCIDVAIVSRKKRREFILFGSKYPQERDPTPSGG
jgi:hypothetical protein